MQTTAPRVLTLVGNIDGSALWRVLQPCAELEKGGYIAHWARNQDDGLAMATAYYGYEAVVLERLSWTTEELPMARAFIDSLHRRGIAVFYACDDDSFLSIDEHLTEDVDRDRLARNKLSLGTMKLCDGVVVSTQRLRTIVSTLTDAPIAVVPNLIDLAWFRAVQAQAVRLVPPLTIGWAGAKRQDADLLVVAEAWRRIAANPKYRHVRFVVQGFVPEVIKQAVPTDRLHLVPWMELAEYPLGLVNIDIMCCSVENNRFNRAKSNIKALEAGARGKTAVVATPTLYGTIIRDNDTGYLAETAAEWEAALSRLVEDGRLRRALARRLGRAVEERYSLQLHASKWLDAWAYLIDAWRERERSKVDIWLPGQSTPIPTPSRLVSA